MKNRQVKLGGNSKDRRRARRFFERTQGFVPACLQIATIAVAAAVVAPPAPLFQAEQEVKLVSDAYGKSYVGRTVVIKSIKGDEAEVQAPKRKSLMVVKLVDLEVKSKVA